MPRQDLVMFWRIRATLSDRPGTLALLAQACGEAGVNIQTVHVFTPCSNAVTDELVLRAPEGWGEEELATLVRRASGTLVAALPCTEEAVVDQPTRYVDAARSVLARPTAFPAIVARLFDADVEPIGDTEDVMELEVGEAIVQVRRTIPFTAAEHARGAALAGLVGDVLERGRPPAPLAAEFGLPPEYVTTHDTVTAVAAGAVVGRASFVSEQQSDLPWQVDLWVDERWRRRRVGSRLLAQIVGLAREAGAGEVMLTAPATSEAALPLVHSVGLRGRIRVSGDSLTVRVNLTRAAAVAMP
jgi:GNAT superfamily N-acetyltransferase